jgi:hypothetical protein
MSLERCGKRAKAQVMKSNLIHAVAGAVLAAVVAATAADAQAPPAAQQGARGAAAAGARGSAAADRVATDSRTPQSDARANRALSG